MKHYRKPSGHYISLGDNVPVSEFLTQVCQRPSENHVFSGNWLSDPMNPLVCWRLKTSQEIDEELTSEADQVFDLTPKDKTILKQIFLIRKQLNPSLTLALFKDELRNDYKGFK